MAVTGRKAEDSARTRAAILDAAESLMRDEGYAAVTTRRVSERAGVNLGLIHYHFGTMDDLFLGLFQRTDDLHLARYDRVLASEHPLRALWEIHSDATANGLIAEFLALANHRKAIRDEIARSCERVRARQAELLEEILPQLGLEADRWSPLALSLLMSGASRAIAMEAAVGVRTGHAEALAFIEEQLRLVQRPRPAGSEPGA